MACCLHQSDHHIRVCILHHQIAALGYVSCTNQISALGYASTNQSIVPHANHVMKLGYGNLFGQNWPNIDVHQEWHINKELWANLLSVMAHILHDDFVPMICRARKVVKEVLYYLKVKICVVYSFLKGNAHTISQACRMKLSPWCLFWKG